MQKGERSDEDKLIDSMGEGLGARFLSSLTVLRLKIEEINRQNTVRDKRLEEVEESLSDLITSVESKTGLFVKLANLESRISRVEDTHASREEDKEERKKLIKTFWIQLIVTLIGIVASAFIGLYLADVQKDRPTQRSSSLQKTN